jgi:hypothetical protein
MNAVRTTLAPLTDWIPPDVRPLLPVEVWWLVLLVATLLALLLAGHLLRGVWRALFRQRRRKTVWDRDTRRPLEELAPEPRTAGTAALSVYHLPARLRLVVLAPAGKGADWTEADAIRLLDRIVPGLSEVASHDQAELRVWPGQLSEMGFINAFHRCTPHPGREGEDSHWVLLAGKAPRGGQPVFLGLALYTDRPCSLGRMNLQPDRWLDVLRLEAPVR